MIEPTGVGVHLKTRDRVAVLDAISAAMGADGLSFVGGGPDAPEDAVRLLLLPPRGAWTSLYPENSALARELAGLLSLQLKAPALTVGRFDEAAFFYVFHSADGDVADEYHSCPDWSKDVDEDDASEEELARTRGDAQALAALLAPGQDAGALAQLLADARIESLRDHDAHSGPTDNSEPLTRLAELLALPDLLEDFDELWQLGLDDEEDVDLRYLAYGTPKETVDLRSLVSSWRDRWRARRKAKPEAEAPEKPAEQADSESPDDESETS